MSEETIIIAVDRDGDGRHLLDEREETQEYYDALGRPIEIWRNSHVETWSSLSGAARQWRIRDYFQQLVGSEPESFPSDIWAVFNRQQQLAVMAPNKWFADMLPVDGPVLGPFDTHGEALAAEIAYLKEHHLPLPTKA